MINEIQRRLLIELAQNSNSLDYLTGMREGFLLIFGSEDFQTVRELDVMHAIKKREKEILDAIEKAQK